jgi:hypothetical protein
VLRYVVKAPPVDPFNGEKPDLRLNDWLPNLERAALWNGWTDDELLLQFAGHLRGCALLGEILLQDRQDWIPVGVFPPQLPAIG